MIDTGTALILSSVIGLAGIILIQTLNNSNWFKRENFKIQKSNILAENRIKLRKLEKELGVPKAPIKEIPTGNILDTLKGLDLEKIQDLLEVFGSDQEKTEGADPLGSLMLMLKENPKVLPAILDKLNIGSKGSGSGELASKYL